MNLVSQQALDLLSSKAIVYQKLIICLHKLIGPLLISPLTNYFLPAASKIADDTRIDLSMNLENLAN